MRGGTHTRSRTTAVGKQHAYRLISSITRWLHWHLPGKATRAQFRAAELPRASQLCFHCTSASSPLRYSKFHRAPTAWPTQSHSVVNSKWWCDHREQLQSPLQIKKKKITILTARGSAASGLTEQASSPVPRLSWDPWSRNILMSGFDPSARITLQQVLCSSPLDSKMLLKCHRVMKKPPRASPPCSQWFCF